MAVTTTYLSGNRIQGRSDDSAEASPTVAKTIFQGAGLESRWVDNSEDISYNATTDVIDFVVSGSGNTDSYATFDLRHTNALNGSDASDTAWVLRFKLDITTYTLGHNSSSALVIGVSNGGTSNGSASQNGIGFEVGVGNNDTVYRLQTANGASWARGTPDATFAETPAVETTYVEVKRTSATNVTVSMYSDSAYSTLLEAETITNVSGTTGLRYLSVKSDTQSENNLLSGTVSEFELWNAVTTTTTTKDKTTITDVPIGTRYEETDTRKIFRLASGQTFSQETHTGQELFNDVEVVSQMFTTGSSKIGLVVASVEVLLKWNSGTPPSTPAIECWIGDGSGNCDHTYGNPPISGATDYGSIAPNILNTSAYQWIKFTPASSARTLVANDAIMIRYNDADTTSDTLYMASDQTGGGSSTETGQYSPTDDASWNDRNFDYCYKINVDAGTSWKEKGT
jgi:hypothetical protein